MSNEIAEKAGFVAVDIETTGLDVETCCIIEIGIIVADRDMNPIAEWVDLVAPVTDLSEMDEFVTEMHESNGLLNELRWANHEGTLLHPRNVGLNAVRWLTQTCGLPTGVFPLTGSSVAFDRTFMKRFMPELEVFFHYRNIDTSTVKELAKVWTPDVKWQSKGQKGHRVLDDIRHTLDEGRFYREMFFDAK